MVSAGTVDDEVVISFVLDQSIIDELAHQTVCHGPSLDIFLELHDLLLQGVDLLVLRLVFNLFQCRCCLLFFDLGLCSAPLAAGLQHVRRDAFRHYREEELVRW